MRRGEAALQSTTSPPPNHTKPGILPRAPPYSSPDPKKPQKLPGESSFHENTGWEKVLKGKGTGAEVPRSGVFLGQRDPQVEVCTTSQTHSQPQPSTARRGHSLLDIQSDWVAATPSHRQKSGGPWGIWGMGDHTHSA